MTPIGVAAESAGDTWIVQALVDRMLVEGIDWVEPEVLPFYRDWCGVMGAPWLDLHGAYRLARELGLRIYGHFDGAPGADDAHMHRAALLLFAEEDEPPKAVVIARDLDGEPDRARGFHQAVEAGIWPFVIAGALAQPEIEAWQIAAWDAEDEPERRRLAGLRGELGFDPCAQPERLTSKSQTDPGDAKRILEVLTTTGRDARARWADAPVARLESAGARCGLADFVRDVRDRVVPVVSGLPASPTP